MVLRPLRREPTFRPLQVTSGSRRTLPIPPQGLVNPGRTPISREPFVNESSNRRPLRTVSVQNGPVVDGFRGPESPERRLRNVKRRVVPLRFRDFRVRTFKCTTKCAVPTVDSGDRDISKNYSSRDVW